MEDYKIKIDFTDELKNLANKKKQYTIPIFIPHKGCKNECVFCNQKKISGELKDVSPDEIDNIIKKYLSYYDDNNTCYIEVAFFGGSFTGLDLKLQEQYLKVVNKYVLSGKIDGIRLSTRPDYISFKILSLLKKYNVKTIELGIQSLDNEVLTISKRGHDNLSVIKASRMIKLYGFNLGHQIMVGLPGSNLNKELYTANEVVRILPDELRIYPVYVIPQSELYDMYLNKKYIPLSFKEAVYRTYEIVKVINKTDIKIIRLGLQSTSEICSSNKDIVGPVCDNFAEYVFAMLVREKIEKEFENINIKKLNSITIIVPKKYFSIIVGPKRININYLEKRYNKKIVIRGEV